MYKKIKFYDHSLLAVLMSAVSQGVIVQDAMAGDSTGVYLEEIIVTAERRSENIQDIAASISAITGSKIEELGVRDVNDLQNFIPGLTIKSQSIGTTKFNIRGVGQAQDDITVESGVGVFIDDIYIPRMGAAGGALYDLERVEVLRGPQGTLYGRNTAGGSINFITKKPSDKLEGKVSADLGNFETYNFNGYISGPLVADKLFAKASILTRNSEGYMKNVFTGNRGNGANTIAGRIGLRYVASDDVEINITADIERSKPKPTMMNIGPNDGYQSFIHALFNDLAGFPIFPGEPATQFYETNVDNDGFEKLDTRGVMLRADVSYNAFDAAYIFGYRESDLKLDADRDMSTLSLLNEAHDEKSGWGSAEARFTSKPEGPLSLGGKLKWTFGLYYFWEDGNRQVDFYTEDAAAIATGGQVSGLSTLRFHQAINTQAYAAFGQTTYSVTPSTRVTAGLRWTEEKKTAGFETEIIDPLGGMLFGPPMNGGIIDEIFATETSHTWRDVTAKFAFEQDLGENAMLYASYSEGFKSGGYNGTSSTQQLAEKGFDPEDVRSYEAGVKASFSNRFSLNLSVFKMDYNNLQTAIVSNGGTPFILNASADIQGAELEGVAILTNSWRMNFAVGYVDSEYTTFEGSPERLGTQVNGVPRWKLNFGTDYVVTLGRGEVTLHGDYSWEDATTEISQAGSVAPVLKSWDVLNFRVGYMPENKKWEIASWVRNATDAKYWLSTGSAAAPSSPADSQVRLPASPRTYGLSLTYFLN